ncbi:Fc.00g109890.m01.CDS01 [Cosmosporella sp. VM-42]
MASLMHLHGRDETFIIVAPGPGTYTTPALTANLVFRVLLGLLANIVSLIPLRHLYRNGEFAAVVFIVNIEIKNLDIIVNALIWRNDNTESWWPGWGLCDVEPYLRNFMIGLYVTCLLAIMRNLAQQVGLMRANPLTVREKRRRNLVQALIMFPLPIVQMAWVWPLTGQRYVVGTLVGCSWVSYPAWPYVVFFVLAPVIVALITAGYAVLIYIRFREVARTTRSALSSNRVATMRAQRTRRRLYLMVVSILTPFLPIVIALAVVNLLDATPLRSFDYDAIHNHGFPYPWDSVIYLPSNNIGFAYMNNGFIPILTAVPIFVFFGMTKDALNSYRRGLLRFGFGYIFPKLYEEYDPDRDATNDVSYGSHLMGSMSTSTSTPSGKLKSFLSSRQMTTMSTSSGGSSQLPHMQSLNALSTIDIEEGRHNHPHHRQQSMSTVDPLPEETRAVDLPHRNPFLMRTRLDFPIPLKLPFFNPKPKHLDNYHQNDRPLPLDSLPSIQHPHWDQNPTTPPVQTRVWSEDEVALVTNSPPERGSPDSASVMVETQLTRETHQR